MTELKLLEENKGKNQYDIWLVQDPMSRTQKIKSIEENIDKLDSLKMKNFALQQKLRNKKSQTLIENICKGCV